MGEEIEDEDWILDMFNALSTPSMEVVCKNLRDMRGELVECLIMDHENAVLVGKINILDEILAMKEVLRSKLEANKLNEEENKDEDDDEDGGLSDEDRRRIVQGSI